MLLEINREVYMAKGNNQKLDKKEDKNMKSTLIKDTTKEERIALIKEWLPDDDGLGADGGMDLWDLYADYINGTKEIAECNAAFSTNYMTEQDIAEGKISN